MSGWESGLYTWVTPGARRWYRAGSYGKLTTQRCTLDNACPNEIASFVASKRDLLLYTHVAAKNLYDAAGFSSAIELHSTRDKSCDFEQEKCKINESYYHDRASDYRDKFNVEIVYLNIVVVFTYVWQKRTRTMHLHKIDVAAATCVFCIICTRFETLYKRSVIH